MVIVLNSNEVFRTLVLAALHHPDRRSAAVTDLDWLADRYRFPDPDARSIRRRIFL